MAQLAERPLFELADALAREIHHIADFLERQGFVSVEAEIEPDNAQFALLEGFQSCLKLLPSRFAQDVGVWGGGRVVGQGVEAGCARRRR